jgi:alkaline phosphatase D
MTPSVTAPNFDEQFDLLTAFFLTIFLRNDFFLPDNVTNTGNPNPHIRFADLVRHGGMILDIKKDSVQANWYYIPIDEPSDTAEFSRAFYTRSGENRLRESVDESAPKVQQDTPAPMEPLITSVSELEISNFLEDVHIYPNPFSDILEVGFQVSESLDMEIQISDTQGKKVAGILTDRFAVGHHQKTFYLSDLTAGVYFLQFHSGDVPVYSRKILKF